MIFSIHVYDIPKFSRNCLNFNTHMINYEFSYNSLIFLSSQQSTKYTNFLNIVLYSFQYHSFSFVSFTIHTSVCTMAGLCVLNILTVWNISTTPSYLILSNTMLRVINTPVRPTPALKGQKCRHVSDLFKSDTLNICIL